MKHLNLGLAGAMIAGLAWGQDVPYTTELISQPYESIEEYSLLDLAPGWDDPEEVLPLPFDMVVWGDYLCYVRAAGPFKNLMRLYVGLYTVAIKGYM